MYIGRTIFSQLMDFLPRDDFHRCVQRYNGDHKIKTFSCFDQYLAMAFAQTLIATATELYADIDLGFDLDNTIYALDSTTIALRLSKNSQLPIGASTLYYRF